MPNLFNYIKPKARLDKNGFDLSHRSVFSCKAGAIYPILSYDMVPNDYVEVDVNDLLRTAPLETAAFARMKQNFEFYFVPYVQLWHNFNTMIAQRKDPVSTNCKGHLFNPVMPLKSIIKMALKRLNNQHDIVQSDFVTAGIYVTEDIHGYNWGYNTLRLLDLLGYGNYLPLWNYVHSLDEDGDRGIAWSTIDNIVEHAIRTNDQAEVYVNLWPLLAYQKIWSDFYRNPWRDIDINEYAFNVDDVPCDSMANADVIAYRTSQATIDADGNIDNVGLFGALFEQRYHTWKKDIFSGSMPNAQFGDVASVQLTNIAIDDGEADEGANGDNGEDNILFNPSDYYVTGQVESTRRMLQAYWNEGQNYPGDVDLEVHDIDPSEMESPGYYINLGSKVMNDGRHAYTVPGETMQLANGTIVANNRSMRSTPERRRALNNLIISTAENVASFSVYDLKRAEMLQRWSETTMRSGYRTKSLFEGHFGVSPRYDMDNHPQFLGSFDSVIQINEVTATAATEGIKLGEMAAKGVSVQNGKIRYQSNDFGVLMCMYYIQPEVEYNAFGISKHRSKVQPFDYFTPEFEDLGLEPVIGAQLNMMVGLQNVSAAGSVLPVTDNKDYVNQIIGYSPRYAEYKTDYDKVHGLFSETTFLGDGGETFVDPIINQLGEFSHWVAAHESAQYSLFENLRDFYIDPNVLDNIFAVASDNSQSSDQFIVNCFFDIKAVRPMSVLGLPNW